MLAKQTKSMNGAWQENPAMIKDYMRLEQSRLGKNVAYLRKAALFS